MGVKWTRDHWSFCWFAVEPKPGEWSFEASDQRVERARQYGVSVFGVLHGTPAWASLHGDQSYTSLPRDWNQWERYVEQTVARFRGKVDVWEIWNEPHAAVVYYDLVRYSYAAIKRANPQAIVIGLSSTNYSGDLLREFVQLGGLKYLDEITSHIYQYTPDLRERATYYKRQLESKPLWNTEGGGW